MPATNWNIEWLNHNSQRSYPLAHEVTRRDTTNTFLLPNDFLLELDLPVHAGMDVSSGRFFIKHIGAFATGYSIVVGYKPASGPAVNVATALINRNTHTRNQTYALGGQGDYADTSGKVVIGKLDAIDQQPPGFYTFSLETARLDVDCIRPIIRGVSSITLINGTQRSLPIRGDIELVAGNNTRLTPILVSGQNPQIRIDFIDGEGSVEECICEGDASPTDPIKRINGINPTADGDFSIIGTDCLTVVPITNGIRLVDNCSKPCCGCVELERITEDLQRLNVQAATIEDFVSRLQVSVESMRDVVLGSKLADGGCPPCDE